MNNIRLLTTKALTFLALFILLDFVAGYFFSFLEKMAMNNNPQGMIAEYSMWKAEGDIIILGASEVHHSLIPSLMSEKLGMSAYNCANDGQHFYYQYCVLNGIIDRKKPKIIIWSVFPNYLKNPTVKEINSLSTLNTFYSTNEYCRKTINYKSYFERLKMFSNFYRYNSRIFDLLKNIFFVTYSDFGYIALNNNGYIYPELKIIPSIENKCEINTEARDAFIEVINKCKESNVLLILIFAPRYEINYYNENECYKELREISSQYNIPLIDEYFSSSIFIDNQILFKDNAHLNDNGARLFTNLICEKIRQILKFNN